MFGEAVWRPTPPPRAAANLGFNLGRTLRRPRLSKIASNADAIASTVAPSTRKSRATCPSCKPTFWSRMRRSATTPMGSKCWTRCAIDAGEALGTVTTTTVWTRDRDGGLRVSIPSEPDFEACRRSLSKPMVCESRWFAPTSSVSWSVAGDPVQETGPKQLSGECGLPGSYLHRGGIESMLIRRASRRRRERAQPSWYWTPPALPSPVHQPVCGNDSLLKTGALWSGQLDN